MDVFRPGQPLTRVLPFRNDLGQALTPISLSYRILDANGVELLATTPIADFDAADGQTSVEVSATQNTLAAGLVSDVRKIELSIVTSSTTYKVVDRYILESAEALIVQQNTLMTYETAVLLSRQLGDLRGWEGADEARRLSALMRAYDQLVSIAYRLEFDDDVVVYEGAFRDLEHDEFAALNQEQINDFRKAQLLQADYLLGGNQTEKDIADGLQSKTVGESSEFYRPRPSLNLVLCRAALQYVGKYINWSIGIARG